MRVPRPVRWLLVLVALVFGWLAAGYFQEAQLRRGSEPRPTAPATRPVGGPTTTTTTNP